MARQIKEVREWACRVVIVMGAGTSIAACKEANAALSAPTGDYMGMLAPSSMPSPCRTRWRRWASPPAVQTAITMAQVAEPFIRRRAIRHLEKGRVVIFGGGTGNPFFTTDTAAALRATEIGAEVVLKATKVDGIYDSDPKKNPRRNATPR
jgi:uridylate kinase